MNKKSIYAYTHHHGGEAPTQVENYEGLITGMRAEGILRAMKPHVFEVVRPADPARWKPQEGEAYWWLSVEKVVQVWTGNWRHHRDDALRWELGNCFQTKEEAERAGENIKEELFDLHTYS